MWKAAGEAFNKVLASPDSLLILLGAAFVILAAAGGVTYNNWFPIPDLVPRSLLGAFGFVLALVGLFLATNIGQTVRHFNHTPF